MPQKPPGPDLLVINTIRTLAMDAVQAANSGHPGTPMALAPVVYCLWQEFLRFDPEDPIWPNRDRFVLSNGHASMLLYSMLHLTGVKAVNSQYERQGELAVKLDDPAHSAKASPPASGWRSPAAGRRPISIARTSSSSITTSTRCAVMAT
jgi:transketolase